MNAKQFWDDYMRKNPYAEGHTVLTAYEHHLVKTGELIPLSNDGKRVFVDGVGDCAIDFEHKLDEEDR